MDPAEGVLPGEAFTKNWETLELSKLASYENACQLNWTPGCRRQIPPLSLPREGHCWHEDPSAFCHPGIGVSLWDPAFPPRMVGALSGQQPFISSPCNGCCEAIPPVTFSQWHPPPELNFITGVVCTFYWSNLQNLVCRAPSLLPSAASWMFFFHTRVTSWGACFWSPLWSVVTVFGETVPCLKAFLTVSGIMWLPNTGVSFSAKMNETLGFF